MLNPRLRKHLRVTRCSAGEADVMPLCLAIGSERSRNTRLRRKLALLWLALAVGAASLGGADALAQTKIRLGKAQAQNFAFLVADVGLAAGIFYRRRAAPESAKFCGDARLAYGRGGEA